MSSHHQNGHHEKSPRPDSAVQWSGTKKQHQMQMQFPPQEHRAPVVRRRKQEPDCVPVVAGVKVVALFSIVIKIQ